jgi:hypothetical protein
MWQYLMCIECKDPSLVEQCKFSLYRADKKFVDKTVEIQRGRTNHVENAEIYACISFANANPVFKPLVQSVFGDTHVAMDSNRAPDPG